LSLSFVIERDKIGEKAMKRLIGMKSSSPAHINGQYVIGDHHTYQKYHINKYVIKKRNKKYPFLIASQHVCTIMYHLISLVNNCKIYSNNHYSAVAILSKSSITDYSLHIFLGGVR